MIEDHVGLELRRDVAESWDGRLDSIDDGNRVGIPALFENRNVDRALAVHANDVVLQRGAIHSVPNVGDEDRLLAFGLERDLI